MIHLGDITKIHGCTAPIVDCMIGGSPCQDLSVAGKRAGFSGERSVLFLEEIRITKEMRYRDRANGRSDQFIRPRYLVWENVPGAFSSNGGRDFQTVLTEIVRIVEPEAPPVPVPEKGWPTSGCLVGDGWSIAYRVLDAQFWGVPQRRRRIALVADFGGKSAPEILFVRKSVSGDFEPGRAEREGTSSGAEKSAGNPVWCLQGNGIDRADTAGCNGKGWKEDVCYTLNTIDRPAVYSFDSLSSNSMKSSNPHSGCRAVDIAKTLDTSVPDPSKNQGVVCILDMAHPCDIVRECGDIVPTMGAIMGTGGNQVPLAAYGIGNGQANGAATPSYEVARTLDTMHDTQAVFCQGVAHTLKGKANLDFREDSETYPVQDRKVRHLTPMECERLQGYPDGWTNIGAWTDTKGRLHKESSDSARYKALGNSIALPPWKWVLKRLCAQYERDATMASLFDGIGGFPLIWEQLNGKGSCLWASEIEEFPIAVTKYHFGGCEQ